MQSKDSWVGAYLNRVKVFDKYFGGAYDSQCIDHPSDCNYNATVLVGFELNYYDKNGVKFKVAIKN